MIQFHSLKVAKIKEETINSVSITFEVPKFLKENYSFKAGQYLTLKAKIKGDLTLRSYSICSPPNSGLLKIGVKAISNGLFSNYLNDTLREGDVLEVSTPEGRFVVENVHLKNTFMGIAAGSGITPVISILKNVLLSHKESKFVLLFGNKSIKETMFYDEIENLKISLDVKESKKILSLEKKEKLDSEEEINKILEFFEEDDIDWGNLDNINQLMNICEEMNLDDVKKFSDIKLKEFHLKNICKLEKGALNREYSGSNYMFENYANAIQTMINNSTTNHDKLIKKLFKVFQKKTFVFFFFYLLH